MLKRYQLRDYISKVILSCDTIEQLFTTAFWMIKLEQHNRSYTFPSCVWKLYSMRINNVLLALMTELNDDQKNVLNQILDHHISQD